MFTSWTIVSNCHISIELYSLSLFFLLIVSNMSILNICSYLSEAKKIKQVNDIIWEIYQFNINTYMYRQTYVFNSALSKLSDYIFEFYFNNKRFDFHRL